MSTAGYGLSPNSVEWQERGKASRAEERKRRAVVRRGRVLSDNQVKHVMREVELNDRTLYDISFDPYIDRDHKQLKAQLERRGIKIVRYLVSADEDTARFLEQLRPIVHNGETCFDRNE